VGFSQKVRSQVGSFFHAQVILLKQGGYVIPGIVHNKNRPLRLIVQNSISADNVLDQFSSSKFGQIATQNNIHRYIGRQIYLNISDKNLALRRFKSA
jgi:hypothetical protein